MFLVNAGLAISLLQYPAVGTLLIKCGRAGAFHLVLSTFRKAAFLFYCYICMLDFSSRYLLITSIVSCSGVESTDTMP